MSFEWRIVIFRVWLVMLVILSVIMVTPLVTVGRS
jgi:hypothetical protein